MCISSPKDSDYFSMMPNMERDAYMWISLMFVSTMYGQMPIYGYLSMMVTIYEQVSFYEYVYCGGFYHLRTYDCVWISICGGYHI